MSSDQGMAAASTGGGTGRLAELIATRGGLAAPEAPFVIEHREALIYMLCEAAELEHGIMCQYLFAAFSLKQAAAEGLMGAELDAVQRWRKQVSHVATQEMLHLALVQNILSAIGAAPHMSRPNLPAPASHYPAGVQLALLPFGEQALRHFMFLERPEGMDLQDAEGLAAVSRAVPVLNERDIVPRGQDFATVGHLYRSIEAGLERLTAKHGEDWLFVGPPRAQATQSHFGWPELVAVTDLASAKQAIEEILEQGEGPRGEWRAAHFGQFVEILDEYRQRRRANPKFDPVRPVMAANVRTPERAVDVPLIDDPLTARVTDLFNVGYEILLQIFERFFAHTEETDVQLKVLADATVAVMVRVLKPLGDLITTLPVGPAHPGMTAGPSFELFYETDYLMPHRGAAWALLAERLNVAVWLCDQLQSGKGKGIAGQLEPVTDAMREISRTLAVHLPAGHSHSLLATPPERLTAGDLDALLGRASDLAAAVAGRGGDDETGPELAGLFQAAHSIVTEAAAGRGCDGAELAVMAPRLVNGVLRPLADVLQRAQASPSAVQAPAGPAAPQADRLWDLAKTATALRVRLGRAGRCPPELAEAAAALQDAARLLVPPAEAAARADELWQLQSGLPATVQTARNGPYLVTNLPGLVDYLGGQQRPVPQLALCRCGQSSIKPRCDGSHASGFNDAKDPNRVADRRDTYPGQQVAIMDNRGICQHSGLCTDRLATVFRTNAEPFVAPSGGRMDEIIRAVRDCPSGALSYAIDGVEAREQVDRAGTRLPSIEITKDGPYRVTGQIALADADGSPVARSQGASPEHYALCRCGQSQNKPFCSGMHWYVGFTDPVVPAGHEPTLFEWAGGFPALTRMTRRLYEQHVPADPLLAAAFGGMPADQPQRLAGWLAAALGAANNDGPADGASAGSGGTGAELRSAIGLAGWPDGDEQRTRWLSLTGRAADEAGLPADPGFRSALSSCLEWASRALGQPDADQPSRPRWHWGPGGPPAPPAPDTAAADTPLPAPGQPVGFAAHIKPLFREKDRQSMSFAFDLGSYDDVRGRAAEILARLQDGTMPCDGAWPAEKTEVFGRWIDAGTQP